MWKVILIVMTITAMYLTIKEKRGEM